MIVQFVSTKEIDLPEAPNGYSWRGSTVGDTDIIGLCGGPMIMAGHVFIGPDGISAAKFGGTYQHITLGTFATPREAALALFAAACVWIANQ